MGAPEFDIEYFARLAAAQDHWWVLGMREVSIALLGPTKPNLSVLDAGCGAGTNLHWLAGLAEPRPVVAIDLSAAAIERCRGLPRVDPLQASVSQLPFADARFDLVVSTDVLQHLTELCVKDAVAEMRRVLRPGGRLLVRTNCMFGRRSIPHREDWRLYTPDDLHQVLTSGGFSVDRISPVNALQGLWASLPRPGRRGRDGEGHQPGVAAAVGTHGLGLPQPTSPARNAALLRVMACEARWVARRGRRLPFGHSLLAVARRPH